VSGQLGLRGGLRRLSTGLIAYGAVGLAVALLGLVALAWTAGRVSSFADPRRLAAADVDDESRIDE
jgi:hypothetical protein